MSDRVIATWLFSESENDHGHYPQVGGNSSSQEFLDVYRRCLCVFFYFARMANPDAKLFLFLNKPLEKTTPIASKLIEITSMCEVEIIVMGYSHEPPSSFQKAWRNQFYVLDILGYLSSKLSENHFLVVLDSDVIWNGFEAANRFWNDLAKFGILGYDLGLKPDEMQNGLNETDMKEIASRFGAQGERLTYFGGEFIALSGKYLPRVFNEAKKIFVELMRIHNSDRSFCFEEAHVLSIAYGTLNLSPASGDRIIKRVWTQPLKYKNRRKEDLNLALLHIPAEKKYGFRRFFNKYLSGDLPSGKLAPDLMQTQLRHFFGIPRNTATKWFLDVVYALFWKVRRKLNL